MIFYLTVYGSFSLLCWNVRSMAMLNKPAYFTNTDTESILTDYINSKGYLPKDVDLPKSSVINNADNDVTYLLSKLSDEELIKLLNEQPKKSEYDLSDILKVTHNSNQNQKLPYELEQSDNVKVVENQNYYNTRFQKISGKGKSQGPVFRLENKQINPYAQKNYADPNYVAIQKLHNLLYSRPQEQEMDDKEDENEEKKELLFDVLVAQLKTLCCKRNKSIKKKNVSKSYQLKTLLNEFMPRGAMMKNSPKYESASNSVKMPPEHIFLIINDDINSNGSEELMYVDPESLERNSSVLLLGPITTQMSDLQLKMAMSRISNELSKPEYLPLLYQLSEGRLNYENTKLSDSLISGPDTRRYIKPHRCNHQSKLARIYGGPKWLICTGYLNLNTPSLYD